MRPLNASELLTVWERGLNRTLLQRVLMLLAAACPDMDPDAIAELSNWRQGCTPAAIAGVDVRLALG